MTSSSPTFCSSPVREYRFQATDETIAELRRLRGAWASFSVSARFIDVRLTDGTVVRVQLEPADVEDLFEAFRIEAVNATEAAGAFDVERAFEDAGDFATGGNDIVLFTGATWSEPGATIADSSTASIALPTGSAMHFSGHPGQLSESAEVVCITTDAIVIAAGSGEGLLIRTGLAPNTLDVVRDRESIARFLQDRGYANAD